MTGPSKVFTFDVINRHAKDTLPRDRKTLTRNLAVFIEVVGDVDLPAAGEQCCTARSSSTSMNNLEALLTFHGELGASQCAAARRGPGSLGWRIRLDVQVRGLVRDAGLEKRSEELLTMATFGALGMVNEPRGGRTVAGHEIHNESSCGVLGTLLSRQPIQNGHSSR